MLRILFGIAEAGLFPGILLYMTYWIPMKLRARFIALLDVGHSDRRDDRRAARRLDHDQL